MKLFSALCLSTLAAGGKPCYARYYDGAHLKAHPKQKVRRIEVDFDQGWREDKGGKNSAADFHAGIGFMLKRSGEWYGQELYRKTADDHFECYLDADGGAIRLIPRGNALRLEVVSGGGGTDQIAVEGARISVRLARPATTTGCSCCRAPIASSVTPQTQNK